MLKTGKVGHLCVYLLRKNVGKFTALQKWFVGFSLWAQSDRFDKNVNLTTVKQLVNFFTWTNNTSHDTGFQHLAWCTVSSDRSFSIRFLYWLPDCLLRQMDQMMNLSNLWKAFHSFFLSSHESALNFRPKFCRLPLSVDAVPKLDYLFPIQCMVHVRMAFLYEQMFWVRYSKDFLQLCDNRSCMRGAYGNGVKRRDNNKLPTISKNGLHMSDQDNFKAALFSFSTAVVLLNSLETFFASITVHSKNWRIFWNCYVQLHMEKGILWKEIYCQTFSAGLDY